MPTPIQTLIHRAVRDDSKPLNILTFPTHERYETGLAKTGHRFYGWQGPNVKTWNTTYAEIPDNYHILDGSKLDAQLPLWVDVDIVLSQNKWAQYDIGKKIATQLNCPFITLEHTLPTPNLPRSIAYQLAQLKGDLDVFISDYSIEKWGWRKDSDNVIVVRHGVDTDLFSPSDDVEREDLVCSVVNDWMNRDWCCGFKLWQQVSGWPDKLRFPINVWGDTPGLSVAGDVPTLIHQYRRSRIFLNTSLVSPVPTVLLEAMSCGCAVVSTNNCMIPEFIEHGENGFLCSTPDEMQYYIHLLRTDEKLAETLGKAARQTIVDNFSLDKFVNNWNEVFKQVL